MYITIDIGGNNVRVASSNSITQPKLKIIKFKTTNNYTWDLKNIISSIQQLKTTAQTKIQGIGLSMPGMLNKNKSCLNATPNLTNWVQKPICRDLSQTFNCQTLAENDANLAALGEALYGYGQKQNFIFIIWGTGIGGCWVQHLNDKINIPPSEPGHQILNWSGGPTCGWHESGCLEGYCGGGNIKRHYKKRAEHLNQKEWHEVISHMVHGLHNFIRMHPVRLVVFGGGVAIGQAQKMQDIQQILAKRIKPFPLPRLKVSKYKDNIALYGALGLFKNVLIEN